MLARLFERLPPVLRPTLTREVGLVIVLQAAVSLAVFAACLLLTHPLHVLTPYLWVASAAVLLLTAAGLWATSRRVAAPVRRVARAARAVAYGDYSRRLHEEGLFDELGDLARSFDAMAARVEEAVAHLDAEREFSAALLERFPEGVAVLDQAGRVSYANAAFLALFPGPAWQAERPELREVLRSASAGALVEAALRERGGCLRARVDLLPPEAPRPAHLRLSVVPVGGSGGPGRALLVAEDETEAVLAEHQRAEWQAMLVHDVKSPLSVVLGSAKVLLEAPGRPEDERSLLEANVRASGRIMLLLNTYLDVMRMEAGARALATAGVPLAAAAAEAVDLVSPLARQAGMTLAAEVPPGAVVAADRDLLVRVLVNLLDNAVKYAAAGRRAVVAARPSDGGWRLWVHDEGPGIAAGDLPFVFERFYRAKREGARSGTGLGLAFCRLAAELHGWSIRAESGPGRGTDFVIDIPAGGKVAAS